ncbi:phospholipase/carboxylesterase family protein-like protein [Melanomma pulvis-pyrius CBS 109.77]|uniref:Phospholipase/carboxylesterase family protein-like protein n=1 Tax=Melanomma pulvis-pyrius CBS 109.77 TaxID=1314802 RepID=A0A6A6XZM0_9PLEO|nr:phospholipase/carboxylesterase family protein-like protein [Melanomma pulvis-pyrius CBS 109.77]
MPKPTQEYPSPLIFPPTSGNHETTLIVLHGRGSSAEKFAAPLLEHLVSPRSTTSLEPQPQTFQSHFPNTKFIFPTASRRRAVAYNRSFTHQWFDMYPLDQYPPEYREHIQHPGLKESAEFVHGLLAKAIEEVGAKNVVLMGLSQGCAIGLTSLLLWRGEELNGFVGMCGWLPLRKSMAEVLKDTEEVREEDEDNPFEEDAFQEDKTKLEHTVDWLREELDFPSPASIAEGEKKTLFNETPLFLGHGTEDPKVPYQLGKQSTEFLNNIGVDVTWKEYPGLGHWYSEDMLRDIVEWLKNREGKNLV